MPVWVLETVAAAFLQNLRNVLQRHASSDLSVLGITYARFLYGLPFAFLFCALILVISRAPAPGMTFATVGFAALGGFSQILANALLVQSYKFRSFAVATTLSKTDVAQSALMSAFILGEPPTWMAIVGILVSFVGVTALSIPRSVLEGGNLRAMLTGKPALFGVASGAGFAFSAICSRAGTLSMDPGTPLLRGGVFLVLVLVLQSVGMGLYLAIRRRDVLRQCLLRARRGVWIGATSALTSLLWFAALAAANVAYVRAIGQIELVFALAASSAVFKEHNRSSEVIGMIVMTAGILMVVFGAHT